MSYKKFQLKNFHVVPYENCKKKLSYKKPKTKLPYKKRKANLF